MYIYIDIYWLMSSPIVVLRSNEPFVYKLHPPWDSLIARSIGYQEIWLFSLFRPNPKSRKTRKKFAGLNFVVY